MWYEKPKEENPIKREVDGLIQAGQLVGELKNEIDLLKEQIKNQEIEVQNLRQEIATVFNQMGFSFSKLSKFQASRK